MRPRITPDDPLAETPGGALDTGLRPVRAGGSRAPAWLAPGTVALLLLALVAVGRFGMPGAPASTIAPGATTSTAALIAGPSGGSASQSPFGAAAPASPGGAVPPEGLVSYAVSRFGYQVFLDPRVPEPQSFNGGRVVTFSFGGASEQQGIVAVATGTPAEGAQVFGASPSTRVLGTTLDALERAYRAVAPGPVQSADTIAVDRVDARLLAVEGFPSQTLWVALAVAGGRSYVITAWGFPTTSAGSSPEVTREALATFLARFRFLGPPLYSSRILDFEVTTPIDEDVIGYWRDTGPIGEANGVITFHAGQSVDGVTWTHSIRVAVGSSIEAAPAIINSTKRIVPLWAPSLAALVQSYSMAVGSVAYEVRTALGGAPALYFDHPGGVGAAVLAVHQGRAYILSSFATDGPSPAPQFQDFLDSFTFLDEAAAAAP